MNNTEDKDHLEANIIGNELILTWDKKGDFHSGITFEWRNHLIHMKVDVDTTWKSRNDTVTINIDGKTSRFGVGRASIGAGAIGKKPKIETLENYLSISQRENKVTIKDNLKEGKPSMFEDTIVFKVINIASSFSFKKTETEENKIREFKSKLKRNEITLYEFTDARININSYVYFEEENLVVDYWKLGDNYEDEYFIMVSKSDLNKLFNEFEIKNHNKAELLIVIYNIFKGENGFNSFKEYLSLSQIPFENRVRHDER
jgi:hypothetical protein